MTESMPVVHVVDDDASFLRATARMLGAAGYTVLTFASASEFLAQVGDAAGCVIADLRMPGMDGLDLQRELRRKLNALPVIFLTGNGDIPTTVQAMRLGAEDFLTKLAPNEVLLEALNRAISRNAQQRSGNARIRELRIRLNTLTPREHDVLHHVMQGQKNKQIATVLDITERTVKLHRTAITTKLHVQSVVELVQIVRDVELFSEPVSTFPKGQ